MSLAQRVYGPDKDCEGERSHARYWARSNCCASKLGKHFAHLGGKWDLVWGEVLCSPGAMQTDGGAEALKVSGGPPFTIYFHERVRDHVLNASHIAEQRHRLGQNRRRLRA